MAHICSGSGRKERVLTLTPHLANPWTVNNSLEIEYSQGKGSGEVARTCPGVGVQQAGVQVCEAVLDWGGDDGGGGGGS